MSDPPTESDWSADPDAAFAAWLGGAGFAEHLAAILAEMAADPDIAVGHCGSYG